jgi:hypothetical protein
MDRQASVLFIVLNAAATHAEVGGDLRPCAEFAALGHRIV